MIASGERDTSGAMAPPASRPDRPAPGDSWPIRLALAVALLAFLTGLGAWWAGLVQDGTIGNAGLILRSEERDGDRVVLSLVRVLEIRGPERWRVAEGDLELDVIGPAAERRAGEELTVVGRWDAERRAVVAAEVHPAPGRRAKKWLGVAGLVALAALLPLWIRPSRGGLRLDG